MSYEDEEQMIIDDETLTEAERSRALKELYREGMQQEYPNEY